MKKSGFNADNSSRNEGCKKLFLGNLTLFRQFIITVTHTVKKTGVAQIYNIDRSDSGSDKISRFCNTAFIDNDFFYLLSDVHPFTFVQLKFTHTRSVYVSEFIIARKERNEIKIAHKF